MALDDDPPIAAHNPQAYIASPGTLNDATWFLDGGATHHVTSEAKAMTTKTNYYGNGKLALGDGSQFPISHIGHSILCTSKLLHLRNILLGHSTLFNICRKDSDLFIMYKGFCLTSCGVIYLKYNLLKAKLPPTSFEVILN